MNRVAAVALACLVPGALAQAPKPPSPERQLFTLVNMERQRLHLPALQWDAKLAAAAQGHSQQLAVNRALSHQFEGEPELARRLSAAGARFTSAAENVAVADDPEEAHLALMHSPGHRANILNPKYNTIGISVAGVDGRIYVTEDFAHVVPTYSAREFRDGVVVAFNRLRLSHHLGPIESHPDSRLDQEACARQPDPREILTGQMNATQASAFTAAEPDDLPDAMRKAASDFTLHRMNIGVCFRQDAADPFPNFWVLVAFSHSQ